MPPKALCQNSYLSLFFREPNLGQGQVVVARLEELGALELALDLQDLDTVPLIVCSDGLEGTWSWLQFLFFALCSI